VLSFAYLKDKNIYTLIILLHVNYLSTELNEGIEDRWIETNDENLVCSFYHYVNIIIIIYLLSILDNIL